VGILGIVEAHAPLLLRLCFTQEYRIHSIKDLKQQGVLLNIAKNIREQIYLKIQRFQQQGSKFLHKYKDFNSKGAQGTNLLDIN